MSRIIIWNMKHFPFPLSPSKLEKIYNRFTFCFESAGFSIGWCDFNNFRANTNRRENLANLGTSRKAAVSLTRGRGSLFARSLLAARGTFPSLLLLRRPRPSRGGLETLDDRLPSHRSGRISGTDLTFGFLGPETSVPPPPPPVYPSTDGSFRKLSRPLAAIFLWFQKTWSVVRDHLSVYDTNATCERVHHYLFSLAGMYWKGLWFTVNHFWCFRISVAQITDHNSRVIVRSGTGFLCYAPLLSA